MSPEPQLFGFREVDVGDNIRIWTLASSSGEPLGTECKHGHQVTHCFFDVRTLILDRERQGRVVNRDSGWGLMMFWRQLGGVATDRHTSTFTSPKRFCRGLWLRSWSQDRRGGGEEGQRVCWEGERESEGGRSDWREIDAVDGIARIGSQRNSSISEGTRFWGAIWCWFGRLIGSFSRGFFAVHN
jgi:hypothetical protein